MGTIKKINTVDSNGTTGRNYLFDSVEKNGNTYTIPDGTFFNGGSWTPDGSSVSLTLDECTYKQTLTVTNNIDSTSLWDGIPLAEVAPYKHYFLPHYYYEYDNGSFTQTNYWCRVPEYLIEWRYYNENTPVSLPENQTLSESGVIPYMTNGNLDVYANWGDPCLIRIIMFVPRGNSINGYTPTGTFTLTNTSESYTYSNNNKHPLTNNFKTVVQMEGASGSDPFFEGVTGECGESQYGGCPKIINNVKCITYFAVKSGTTNVGFNLSNLLATNANGTETHSGWYRPKFAHPQNAGSSTSCCWPINHLCKKDDTLNIEPQRLYYNENNDTYQYMPSGLINSDVTIFVPLEPVTFKVYANPEDGNVNTHSSKGKVKITTIINYVPSLTDMECDADFLEGETVYFYATPKTGFVFDHWELNSEIVSHSQSYSTVMTHFDNNSHYVAYFVTEPANTYYFRYNKYYPHQ